jgi:hypothetical protein
MGLVLVAVLALVSFVSGSSSKYRWCFGLLSMAFALVVAAKNVAYFAIVSQPHAENSVMALHSFASALAWVTLAELVVGIAVLAIGLSTRGLVRLSVASAVSCWYAALCMWGWHAAYQSVLAGQMVHYQLILPALHLVMLLMMLVGAVGALVSDLKRKPVR